MIYFQWWWLLINPAKHNDYPKIELLGAWEPTCSEGVLSFSEEKGPKILFLMEKKRTVKVMRSIQADLPYNAMLAVPCLGRKGGLAMPWKEEEVNLHVQTYT